MPSSIVLKLNNLALYGSASCVLPYATVYLQQYTKASESYLGQLMLVTAISTIVTSLYACSLADRRRAHRKVYLTCLLAYLVSFATLLIPVCLAEWPAEVWFHVAATCVLIGNVAITVCMSMSDTFCVHFASNYGISYGSMRFWGAAGWASVSLMLSFINGITWMPFLSPALLLFIYLSVVNVALVAFWPNPKPFKLGNGQLGDSEHRTRFVLARRLSGFIMASSKPDTGNMDAYKNECKLNTVPSDTQVVLKASRLLEFDSALVRRSSQSGPALADARTQLSRLDAEAGHFEYVVTLEAPPKLPKSKLEQLQSASNGVGQTTAELDTATEDIGLLVHLRVIGMIATRNKLVARFLVMYVLAGFVVAQNWMYLFPYLIKIDAIAFAALSGRIMVCNYIGETIFYTVSSRIMGAVRHSHALSIVMVLFAARYLAYMAVGTGPSMGGGESWLSLDSLLLTELVLSVNKSWFDCVLNESAAGFAHRARDCVPRLVELGLVQNSPDAIERVNQGFKVSMVSISSGCFDGIGVGLGSLLGGMIIEHYGYSTLWASVSVLALFGAIVNWLLTVCDEQSELNKPDNNSNNSNNYNYNYNNNTDKQSALGY